MQKGIWIWKYKDFEFYHGMKYLLSREERGKVIPAFYDIPNYSHSVRFRKTVELPKAETVKVYAEGSVCFVLDGKRQVGADEYTIPEGKHEIGVAVGNVNGMCALKIVGEYVYTDLDWIADKRISNETLSEEDKKLLCAPVATSPLCAHLDTKPGEYELPEIEVLPVSDTKNGNERIIDIGRESVVSIKLSKLDPDVKTEIKYGESLEETYSDRCVIIDSIEGLSEKKLIPRACRYIRFIGNTDFELNVYSSELPMSDISSFDAQGNWNSIYEISKYTLKLCSRMFLLDGIKRDIWPWAGDNYLTCATHYYAFFDKEVIKRTLILLRGNDHNNAVINNILGFPLYWFITIRDYYFHTGDIDFLKRNYESMRLQMEFLLTLCDGNGFLLDTPGVWNFIDWHPLQTRGANSCIQMLFGKAMESLSECAEICGDDATAESYKARFCELSEKINALYWDDEQKGYVSTVIDGVKSTQIRRHQNYFAIIFGYADEKRRQEIIDNVLMNKELPKITTPFFKFFEYDVMCQCGMVREAFDGIKAYWGDIIDQGATSIWEEFDSNMSGVEHYAMYKEPFDKSLCHAWGSVPVYFIGKYLAGVTPSDVGYSKISVRPTVDIMDFDAKVPVNGGYVKVSVKEGKLTVLSSVGGAALCFSGKEYALEAGKEKQIDF